MQKELIMTEITKEQLRKLYYENTNEEVCRVLGVTKATLISYLKKAGIKLKGKGGGLVGHSAKKIKLVD
jgi:transcriptional antiterminator